MNRQLRQHNHFAPHGVALLIDAFISAGDQRVQRHTAQTYKIFVSLLTSFTMPPFALVKASNDGYCPPYVPVVVVFGGTSGIGKAMTKRLSKQLDGRVHVIVVGRNKVAADALFSSLPNPTGSQQELERCGYEFIPCDISLMRNVHQAAEDIAKRCPKINYLILASGKAFFGKRKETEEGLNSQLVLRYYWKFAVINDLLSNLRAAKDIGEAAGVFVILGNGMGPKINFDDLGVKRHHRYGVGPLSQGMSYGDLMLSVSLSLSQLCRSIEKIIFRCTPNASLTLRLLTCSPGW